MSTCVFLRRRRTLCVLHDAGLGSHEPHVRYRPGLCAAELPTIHSHGTALPFLEGHEIELSDRGITANCW